MSQKMHFREFCWVDSEIFLHIYRTSLAGTTDYYAQVLKLGLTNRTKDKYITSAGMDL